MTTVQERAEARPARQPRPPYEAYATIVATFGGLLAAAGALGQLRDADPQETSWLDFTALTLATFKASRTIEDIYELTYICKDGSRFPAIVSITALRDDYGDLIGYLLIGTDNSARKRVESELHQAMAAAEKALERLTRVAV